MGWVVSAGNGSPVGEVRSQKKKIRKRRKTMKPHSHTRTTTLPPHPAEGGAREQNPPEGRNTQAGDERRKDIDSWPTGEEEGKREAEGTGEAKPTRANKQRK